MGTSVYVKRFNVSGTIKAYVDGKEETEQFTMQVYARSKTDAKYIAVGRKVVEYRDKGKGWCSITDVEVE